MKIPKGRQSSIILAAFAVGLVLAGIAHAADAPKKKASPAPKGATSQAADTLAKGAPSTEKGVQLLQAQQQKFLDSLKGFAARMRPVVMVVMGVTGFLGIIILLFGWAIVRALFVPFAMLSGLQTGWAFGWTLALQMGRKDQEFIFAGALAFLAMVFYGFASWKAKPIGAYLMMLSPFLAAGLMGVQTGMAGPGYVCLLLGFTVGFLAMRRIRFFMVVATSLVGTELLITTIFLFWALFHVKWLDNALTWTLGTPFMPLIFAGLIFILGCNVQFTMGPGDLADAEADKWRRRHRLS